MIFLFIDNFKGPIQFCREKYELSDPTTATPEAENENLDPLMDIDPRYALSVVFK